MKPVFTVGLSVHQVFYWSHLSYVWVWSLLMVHCANFWKWFVVPGFVFLLEKIIGIAASRMGGLYIVEVNLLPSKVGPAPPPPPRITSLTAGLCLPGSR